jgi:pyruvate, water dikinase
VSSLRNDFFLLESGIHPAKMVRTGRGAALEDAIAEGIIRTSSLFAGKPVWYKTLDAPTDEFRRLDGGDEEPAERNPLLGWRGLGRELEEPELFALELRAVRRALDAGATNIAIKLPFVRFAEEYEAAKRIIERAGMRPHEDLAVGVSVETPGIAAQLQRLCDLGVDFVSVGVSDLVMCVLALDRESERVARLFQPAHPAVVEALAHIAGVSHSNGVFTCACGESAHDDALLPELVTLGYDAIGVSLPYFAPVKQRLAEIEGG